MKPIRAPEKNGEETPELPHLPRIVAIVIGAFAVIAVVLVVLDWKGLENAAASAMWPATIGAVGLSMVSDVLLSYGYVIVNKAFGIRVGWFELLEIGYATSALNNILALFGAAGHSMRLVMIKRRGIESGGIIAASLFHSYVNNILMVVLFVIGLIALLLGNAVKGNSVGAIILTIVLAFALLGLVTVMVMVQRMRVRVLRSFARLWKFLFRRDITSFIREMEESISRGLQAFRGERVQLVLLFAIMMAVWFAAAGALWFCFLALGRPVRVSLILAGFSVGISAGNLSMIPGGLGVQEASMAGVFALLGVPFAEAALAAVIFRIANNFAPFVISLPVYGHIVRGRAHRRPL